MGIMMIAQLLLILVLAFGDARAGLPIQIERADTREIAYGFGEARYLGLCQPAPGWAYAQRLDGVGTLVFSGACVVLVR